YTSSKHLCTSVFTLVRSSLTRLFGTWGEKSMYGKLLTVMAVCASMLPAASVASKRLDAATDAFKEVMAMPDRGIPQDLLERAQCVVIVPDLKRAAFFFGAKYGKGFFVCRNKGG